MRKWLLFIILLTLIVACAKKEDTILVNVQDQKLTREAFVRRYRLSKDYQNTPKITPEAVKKFTEENLIENLFFLADAYEKKYDQTPAIAAQILEERKRILTRRNGPLYRRIVNENFSISEQEAKDFYDQLKNEVKIAHIVVASKALADSIYGLLTRGGDFNKLAEKHSIDMGSRERGGALEQYFVPGTLGKEFDQTVFALKETEISTPVRTNFGYHIIKVLAQRPVTKKPFDSLKTQLQDHLKEMKVNQISESYIDSLILKYHITIDDANAAKIIKLYREMEPKTNPPQLALGQLPGPELDLVLVKFDGGEWTIRNFLSKYNNAAIINRFPLLTVADVSNFIQKEIILDIMYQEALRLNLDQDEKFQDEFRRSKDLIVLRAYRQEKMYENIQVEEAEIKAFYEANKSRFSEQPFESVRNVINSELRGKKVKAQLDSLLAELRKQYPVHYHDSVIKLVVAEMNKLKAGAVN